MITIIIAMGLVLGSQHPNIRHYKYTYDQNNEIKKGQGWGRRWMLLGICAFDYSYKDLLIGI